MLYTRQPFLQGSSIIKIIFQNIIQAGKDLITDYFTGDKLAFIKTVAVTEQQCNLANQNILAVRIRRIIKFRFNSLE